MGGASGLNILQQKSWHVLRRHNIERVRKDQREERERQQKEDDRKDLAEFESKLDHLRCVCLVTYGSKFEESNYLDNLGQRLQKTPQPSRQQALTSRSISSK